VLIAAGGKDNMRLGSQAVHKEILAQSGRSEYVELPDAVHNSTPGRTWGNRKNLAWLFQQSRGNNPPAGEDPFPGGAYPHP
jgi:hypothetical protein